MKKNYKEVKTSVYVGMSIFDSIKDIELKIQGNPISLQDKKYLSLYLGIINAKNKASNYLKEKNIKFNFKIGFKYLKQEEYINIYNNYFIDILKEVDFSSIENHLNYLLTKKVIQDFNFSNDLYIDDIDKNKQLIKTIK